MPKTYKLILKSNTLGDENLQKKYAPKLGTYENTSYLCNVKGEAK